MSDAKDCSVQKHAMHLYFSETCGHLQGVAAFLENARRARRLNSHVFSVLRARMPHEVKLASLIKQNGSVVNRVKYPVTPSTYTVLPHQ